MTDQAWETLLFYWWLRVMRNFGKCDSGKGETEEIRSEKLWKNVVYYGNSMLQNIECEGKYNFKQSQTPILSYLIKE